MRRLGEILDEVVPEVCGDAKRAGVPRRDYTLAMVATAREAYRAGASLSEAARVVQMKHGLELPPSKRWVSEQVDTRSARHGRQLKFLGSDRDEIQRKALRMALNGFGALMIAEELGITYRMACSLLQDMRPTRSQAFRRAYELRNPGHAERKREAARLKRDGLTLKEIGARFGVSGEAARLWIKEADRRAS